MLLHLTTIRLLVLMWELVNFGNLVAENSHSLSRRIIPTEIRLLFQCFRTNSVWNPDNNACAFGADSFGDCFLRIDAEILKMAGTGNK